MAAARMVAACEQGVEAQMDWGRDRQVREVMLRVHWRRPGRVQSPQTRVCRRMQRPQVCSRHAGRAAAGVFLLLPPAATAAAAAPARLPHCPVKACHPATSYTLSKDQNHLHKQALAT